MQAQRQSVRHWSRIMLTLALGLLTESMMTLARRGALMGSSGSIPTKAVHWLVERERQQLTSRRGCSRSCAPPAGQSWS